MNVERRTVLQIGGLVAVGGVVAACGSSSSTADTATSAAAPTGGVVGSAGASGAAKTADIPVGGGLIVADKAVVITQPTAGEFKAFSAICTHQGCLVGSVENNEIICPCHGSKFSGTDGSVITGPAQTPLAPAGITVDGGNVVING
jgi:Rieske Fe-S protein